MAKFLSKDGKFYMRDGKLLQYLPILAAKTWVINKSPDVSTDMLVTINFTSNGESFDQFQINSVIPGIIYLKNGTGSGYQYDSSSWSYGEAYRTVAFETAPTGELLTWLQANAVPQ